MAEELKVQKTFRVKVTALTGEEQEGRFSAIVSTFDEVDHQGDSVDRGAFAETVEAFKAGKVIPVVWSHDYWNPESFIGQFVELKETDTGLYVEGELDVDDNPRAAQVWRQMKRGRIVEFSVGGVVEEWYLARDGDEVVLHIKRWTMWEAGPCFKGANPSTELLSVKSRVMKTQPPADEPAATEEPDVEPAEQDEPLTTPEPDEEPEPTPDAAEVAPADPEPVGLSPKTSALFALISVKKGLNS